MNMMRYYYKNTLIKVNLQN